MNYILYPLSIITYFLCMRSFLKSMKQSYSGKHTIDTYEDFISFYRDIIFASAVLALVPFLNTAIAVLSIGFMVAGKLKISTVRVNAVRMIDRIFFMK